MNFKKWTDWHLLLKIYFVVWAHLPGFASCVFVCNAASKNTSLYPHYSTNCMEQYHAVRCRVSHVDTALCDICDVDRHERLHDRDTAECDWWPANVCLIFSHSLSVFAWQRLAAWHGPMPRVTCDQCPAPAMVTWSRHTPDVSGLCSWDPTHCHYHRPAPGNTRLLCTLCNDNNIILTLE